MECLQCIFLARYRIPWKIQLPVIALRLGTQLGNLEFTVVCCTVVIFPISASIPRSSVQTLNRLREIVRLRSCWNSHGSAHYRLQ